MREIVGVSIGFVFAAFASIAVVASAATMTTALLVNMIALPGLALAYLLGARRIAGYGAMACAACLASSILVLSSGFKAEYLIIGIYFCLFFTAVMLGRHHVREKLCHGN
jgi:hypothetical protein